MPLSFGNIQLGSVGLSLNWQFLGVALLTSGAQAFFLGCIAQVLFDYTGRQRRRWLRIFPYTRTVLIAFALVVAGIALAIPLVATYIGNGLALEQADALPNHLAVTGGALRDSRRPALRLHAAAARCGRRDDAAPPGCLGRLGSARVLRQVLRPVGPSLGALDREGSCAAFATQRGDAVGRARDGVPALDVRALAVGRGVPPRVRVGSAQHSRRRLALLRAVEPRRRAARGPRRDPRSRGVAGRDGRADGRSRRCAGNRRARLPLRYVERRCEDECRRHVLPGRQARQRLPRDRRGARGGHGPGERRAVAGRVPRGHRAVDSPTAHFASATATSMSTSRPRTSSTGSGRGLRRAGSSCSTTTASRPVPA